VHSSHPGWVVLADCFHLYRGCLVVEREHLGVALDVLEETGGQRSAEQLGGPWPRAVREGSGVGLDIGGVAADTTMTTRVTHAMNPIRCR
jgi:hypothetical protein